jgi:hypothetical protein
MSAEDLRIAINAWADVPVHAIFRQFPGEFIAKKKNND